MRLRRMDGCRMEIGLSTLRGREPGCKREQPIATRERDRYRNRFSRPPAPAEISIFAGVILLIVRLLPRTRK